MLDPPVGEVAVELDGDLDPLAIRVVEAEARGARSHREDARLVRLDRLEVAHGCER